MNREVENCIYQLADRFAFDLSVYDWSFLEKVIIKRLSVTFCETAVKYMEYISQNPEEINELLVQLSNSYSEFFRNPLTFSMLEKLVIPKLYDKFSGDSNGNIRIWSAGCAGGQEPYSLAILFNEYAGRTNPENKFRIFATDVSVSELEKARKGVFEFNSVKNVRLDWSGKYFTTEEDLYHFDEKLKKLVHFSEYDLLDRNSSSPSQAIYGDFDLIVCCNVLIYYTLEYQRLIIQKFSRALKKGGFLVTSEAESGLFGSLGEFRQYVSPSAIFVKN